MKELEKRLADQLERRRAQNALRILPGPSQLVDFCSNDYLGLARRPFSTEERGGSTGSRLISGNSLLAQTLERELAAFHEAEAGLLFPSGYTANLGLLSCVPQRQDTLIYDELAHASLREGILLNNARSFSFRHNDLEDLRRKLNRAAGQAYIVVESVYSMDGDEAPLVAIAEMAQTYGAALIVDEAHATGVFGPGGRGMVSELGLEKQVWARVHTFGKALGSHGAIVLGSGALRSFLINFCRAFIYTTAPPDSLWARVRWGYEVMQTELSLLERLRHNIDYFRSGLSPLVRPLLISSRFAIQCLVVPGNDQVKQMAGKLQQAGLDVRPILHPTVPKGKERLRVCLHAFNTELEIDLLCEQFNQMAL